MAGSFERFENISQLIRAKRLRHPKKYSQLELSKALGYRNGQFVSNLERGICNVPFKSLKPLAKLLNISKFEMKKALIKDYENTLDEYLK